MDSPVIDLAAARNRRIAANAGHVAGNASAWLRALPEPTAGELAMARVIDQLTERMPEVAAAARDDIAVAALAVSGHRSLLQIARAMAAAMGESDA